MTKDKDLKERTKQFALKIIKLVASLPRTREADIVGRQLLKAGTFDFIIFPTSAFRLPTSNMGGYKDGQRNIFYF